MMRLTFLALACASGTSFAQNVFYSGDLTTDDPTYNRTFEDGTGLSGIGTNVYYDVQPFYVTVSGSYTMESSQPGAWDGMIFVYSPFNPSTPLVGYVAGDDDYTGPFSLLGGSGNGLDASKIVSMNLVANQQYYAIQTSFDNGTTGHYDNAIGGGPGNAVLGSVPEPGTLALVGAGLAALARRRRR